MKIERIREPILVTGATGFIGRRLVHRLRQEDYKPRAFVLPHDPIPSDWNALFARPDPAKTSDSATSGAPGEAVQVVRGDVTQRASVAAATRGARTVFHLAAMVGDWGRAEQHERVTVRGTEHVLCEAAHQEAHVILASSVVVYGNAIGTAVCDENRPFGTPLGPYSRSKQAQERLAQKYEGSEGLKVTIVRPTNVFGPGSVPWVDQAVAELERGSPALIGGGRKCAGLTYVDNVVDVLIRAAERPATIGRIYNASDDNGVTWLRYFTELAEIVGAPSPKSIPHVVARLAAAPLETAYRLARRTGRPPITREALNLVGSHHRVPISRAQQELGYSPPVSYADGMKAVAAYLHDKRR